MSTVVKKKEILNKKNCGAGKIDKKLFTLVVIIFRCGLNYPMLCNDKLSAVNEALNLIFCFSFCVFWLFIFSFKNFRIFYYFIWVVKRRIWSATISNQGQ